MHDHIQFTPAAELQPYPRENNSGFSRQLAIYPMEASKQDFIWRISVTEILRSGEFSTQEDIDRILMLTEGGPLHLIRQDTGQESILQAGARLYFAGETPYKAELTAGAVRGFNIRVRRKQAHGLVELRRGRQSLTLRPGETILHGLHGSFQADLPVRLGGSRQIHEGDTLQITLDYVPAFSLALTPLNDQACLADARINLYPGS